MRQDYDDDNDDDDKPSAARPPDVRQDYDYDYDDDDDDDDKPGVARRPEVKKMGIIFQTTEQGTILNNKAMHDRQGTNIQQLYVHYSGG